MMRYLLLLLAWVALSVPSFAGDWPAWRGPDRTGVSKETGLLKTWPKEGPKLLWKTDKAGLGYSGMAIVGGVVYTMGTRGDDEYLIAFDDKGNEKWATKIGPLHDWSGNSWSKGPNATPTVDGELVYGLSSRGMLLCAHAKTGKQEWKIDCLAELGGQVNPVAGGYEDGKVILGWGYTSSPLVDGDNLIILPGGPKGLFATLNKKTGKTIWRSKAVTDQATYSSPVLATIGGTKQYITQTQDGVVGVSAADGSLLWKHKRAEVYEDVVCPTPIVRDNLVYATIGTSAGLGDVVKVTGADGKFKVEEVWSNKTLNNYHSGVVLLGNHLYGHSEGGISEWVCQELANGNKTWATGRKPALKAAGIVAAEDRLYVLDDKGTVAMIEASPKGYKVISQFPLPQKADKTRKSRGGIWTHPSLSDGKLYVRDQELLFCYEVKP
jgi:outer membrane protein assembly factor BamB